MNNPIIQREVISFLRSTWSFVLQFIPAIALAILVVMRWPSEGQVDTAGSQARHVFQLFAYGMLTTIILLVPIYPATTIVRERQQGTLALLLNSPMNNWSIYFGKLFGSLICVILPLVMSGPAAAAWYAMTGVDLYIHLGRMYIVLFLATIQFATLSLLVSSFANTTDSALRISFALVLLMVVATLAPYQLVQGGDGGPYALLAEWMRSLSPIPALMEITGHGDVTAQGLVTETGFYERFVVLAIVSALAFMICTAFRLKQTMFDRPRPQGVMTQDRSRLQQFGRRMVFLIDPQRRTNAISDRANPVLVKEFRTRRFGRSQWLIRLILICALISLAVALIATTETLRWGVETIGGMMVMLQVALISILTPSLAAGLISSEHENGGWTLLMMTPLSAGRIVIGKLLSVAWTVGLTLFATLPGYMVMMFIKPVLQQQVLYVIVCLLLTALFAVMLSAAVSSFYRRTASATITCYTILTALLAAPMLVWLARDKPFGHQFVEMVLQASPMAAAFNAMEVHGFQHYDLLPLNWWLVSGASIICCLVLGVQTFRLTRPL